MAKKISCFSASSSPRIFFLVQTDYLITYWELISCLGITWFQIHNGCQLTIFWLQDNILHFSPIDHIIVIQIWQSFMEMVTQCFSVVSQQADHLECFSCANWLPLYILETKFQFQTRWCIISDTKFGYKFLCGCPKILTVGQNYSITELIFYCV